MNKQRKLAYIAIKEVSEGKRGAITTLLKYIGVSRQAYYQWLNHKETVWQVNNRVLQNRSQYWFDFHNQSIGTGSILHDLMHDEKINFRVTLKMVRRVQTELSLRCQSRPKRRNRRKESEQFIQDNLLNQNFEVSNPYETWLADSTELKYGVNGEHKVRLSGVLDLFGRRLISYHLSPTETSVAEIEVFQKAFEVSGDVHPMVHTDRGSAYTSKAFGAFLDSHEVVRSMSRPGTPYDNAPMERWWNEFKCRWMERRPLAKTYRELVKLVEEGIEYFNHYWRAGIRNGLTPDEFWDEAV